MDRSVRVGVQKLPPERKPLEEEASGEAGEASNGEETDPDALFDRLFEWLAEKEEGNLLQTVEDAMIRRSMIFANDNQTKAAALLGMPKTTFKNRLARLLDNQSSSEK